MISCLIIRLPQMMLQKNKRSFFANFETLGPGWWHQISAENFRRNFVKLWPAVYPSRMAPFGLKLWENAFQTIPNISLFDAEKKIGKKFLSQFSSKKKFVGKSTNCLFLRSYGFLDVIGRCASKSYPQSFDFQLSTTFGGGVKEIVSVFFPTFGQKWLQPFSFFG